eukprot:TRINITY_DN24437_c0_g1_i1.p1 TRINITY_DN24437_c0_g1~~TRINITY_DN24437_c0_g1_i1.p1  ORF type:complete len:720 (+),score=116.73 TRINITY_DN24437_c0_g1_i1:114-2273(+)
MVFNSWFCFRWTTTFRRTVRRLDLRFENEKVELKYRQHFQRKSFATAACSGIVYSSSQLATHVLGQDELRLHLPSRVAYLTIQALAVAGMCTASVGGLMKSRVRRLEACCWELVWAVVLTLNMLACAFRTHQLDEAKDGCGGDLQDFIRSQEISCLLAPTAFVAVCCWMLPVRCVVLLPLTCLALSISIHQVASWTCQPSARNDSDQAAMLRDMVLIMIMVAFILVVLYGTAHRVEKTARQRWLTSIKERATEEALVCKRLGKATLARDLKVFRAAGCHVVVSLREDLRVNMRFGDMAESFFGRDVNGISLLDLLDGSSRQKFDKVCKRVDGSRIPRSINATLISKGGVRERCKLLLVFHGQPGRHFLVGIRARNSDPKKRRRISTLESFSDEIAFHDDPPKAIVEGSMVAGRCAHLGSEKSKKKRNPGIPLQCDVAPSAQCDGAPAGSFCPDTYHPPDDDSDGSASSVCSLMYTDSSEEDSAGISNLCKGRETHVQTDANLGMKDACVETDIGRRNEKFRCSCCARPPAPLDYDQREKMAVGPAPRNSKKRRKSARNAATSSSQKPTIESLQGNWTIQSQFIGIAQSFMHRLTFIGEKCLDATGKCWKLHNDNGKLSLIKGRMWVEGDILYREGKSGIVMMFQREAEGADTFEEALADDAGLCSSDDSQSDASSEDNEEEQDSIWLLEQMVGQANDNDDSETLHQHEHIDLDDNDDDE